MTTFLRRCHPRNLLAALGPTQKPGRLFLGRGAKSGRPKTNDDIVDPVQEWITAFERYMKPLRRGGRSGSIVHGNVLHPKHDHEGRVFRFFEKLVRNERLRTQLGDYLTRNGYHGYVVWWIDPESDRIAVLDYALHWGDDVPEIQVLMSYPVVWVTTFGTMVRAK